MRCAGSCFAFMASAMLCPLSASETAIAVVWGNLLRILNITMRSVSRSAIFVSQVLGWRDRPSHAVWWSSGYQGNGGAFHVGFGWGAVSNNDFRHADGETNCGASLRSASPSIEVSGADHQFAPHTPDKHALPPGSSIQSVAVK
jgi:hypothetical protein